MNNKEKKSEPRLNFLYLFFCWCSGARLYILRKCPTEYNKFFGIGTIVFLTGMVAAITGAYALYTVFENKLISAVLGAFWGVLIFFIDWYIVSSLKKENRFLKELMAATPRLILAILLAVVISKPLELRLFQPEIEQEIETLKRDKSINYVNQVFEEFDQIARLEKENENLKKEISQKEGQRNELFEMIVEEAEGRSPTNRVGKGPVYKEKKLEYDKVSEELKEIRSRNLSLISQNDERIEQLRDERGLVIKKGSLANENYDGFLARIEALGSLSDKNKTIAFANVFILLLFIIIESSPIIVKLMSKRGPYDELIELEEYTVSVQTNKHISELDHQINVEANIMKTSNGLKTETNQKIQNDFIDKTLQAGLEINKMKVEQWKKHEIEKFEKRPDDFYRYIESITNQGLKNNLTS